MPAHRKPHNSDELLRQARRLMDTPAYRTFGHADGEKVRSTVTKIFKTVYGSGPPMDPQLTGQIGEAQ